MLRAGPGGRVRSVLVDTDTMSGMLTLTTLPSELTIPPDLLERTDESGFSSSVLS